MRCAFIIVGHYRKLGDSRVLINDFSDSNPYPSAVAINIKRDNDDLHLFLR